MMALMPVIDRYGPAIEYDLLHEFSTVELHQFFRGERPWGQLGRLLGRLPPSSRYIIAKRNDPDVALAVARAMREARKTGDIAKWRPPAEEWDTAAELAAATLDRLGEIEALLADLPIAGKKRKAKPPRKTARPASAIERAEQQLSDEHVAEIVQDVVAGQVSEEEYRRIAAEVDEQRQAAAQAEAGQTVA
jgi:hypothetical protein